MLSRLMYSLAAECATVAHPPCDSGTSWLLALAVRGSGDQPIGLLLGVRIIHAQIALMMFCFPFLQHQAQKFVVNGPLPRPLARKLLVGWLGWKLRRCTNHAALAACAAKLQTPLHASRRRANVNSPTGTQIKVSGNTAAEELISANCNAHTSHSMSASAAPGFSERVALEAEAELGGGAGKGKELPH